ncbi:MAG: DUF5058 family protein [Pyramidobacter sp.]|uniref:DUF5058 family protein n=1 Tax=unclassified Pyramidobacter TaxID=2632171 RepID=UPI00294B6E78|nr:MULTISPECIES: DUF5058 family protein [unclassified Pyramidobacter]MDY4032068.1 DUF5058 family protein [Pyramidobacter sp.]WOL40478.1 DUF5058 family protein [Pyramidobacter sp. YE332]
MPQEVFQVANNAVVWFLCFIVVAVALIQSLLYIRLSLKAADAIGFERRNVYKGLWTGAVSSVGPSFAVFLVMVGLISAVGAPIAWLRCSIIGSAPIEMTGAMLGAQAYGVELNSAQYDLNALAASWWTMSVNGIGWLIVAAVLTPHLEKVRAKFGGGDARWLVLIAVAATTGCYGYLSADTIGKALRNYRKALAAGGSGTTPLQPMIATIAAGIAMAILIRVSKKRPKLREYNLGLAMLAGMIVATFF